MNPRYQRLAAQIRDDMKRWQTLGARLENALAASEHIPSIFLAGTVGKLLHDFYTGLEEIFARIARELGEGLPTSERWHRDLLEQMALDIPDVRPPVIQIELVSRLLPYLAFRHVFRNVYGYELEWHRIQELATEMPVLMEEVTTALETFIVYLGILATEA